MLGEYLYLLLAVDKAYKLLLDQDQKKRILDVIHAGKEYVEHMVSVQTLWLCLCFCFCFYFFCALCSLIVIYEMCCLNR